MVHTRCLLGFITRNGTKDSILLSGKAIRSTLSVSFGLSCLVFALTGSMLLLAGRLPRRSTRQVPNRLDGGALDRVEFTRGLATLEKQ